MWKCKKVFLYNPSIFERKYHFFNIIKRNMGIQFHRYDLYHDKRRTNEYDHNPSYLYVSNFHTPGQLRIWICFRCCDIYSLTDIRYLLFKIKSFRRPKQMNSISRATSNETIIEIQGYKPASKFKKIVPNI